MTTSQASATHGLSTQAASNAAEWAAGRHLHTYANDVLTPVEVQILLRYRTHLVRRVLDLGCGAGRVLDYLVMIGADAHGIDLAPAMVDHCRRRHPTVDVQVGDVSAMTQLFDGPFDAVLAPDNLIDVFGDAERRQLIDDVRTMLAPDGLFIFSSHDLGWSEANDGPREWEQPSRAETLRKLSELSLVRLLGAIRNRREIARNRRRLAPMQERHADFAVLNDFPHNYSLLHYYIRRDAQDRQLRELGFELIEALAADGRSVPPGGHGTTDSLYYVARPRTSELPAARKPADVEVSTGVSS